MELQDNSESGMKILNPTIEAQVPEFNRAQRAGAFKDAVVGIISNGKQGTDEFFAIFARQLREKLGVKDVELLTKENYSAPAEEAIVSRINRWNLAITGIGD